jgi:hypothetical protein
MDELDKLGEIIKKTGQIFYSTLPQTWDNAWLEAGYVYEGGLVINVQGRYLVGEEVKGTVMPHEIMIVLREMSDLLKQNKGSMVKKFKFNLSRDLKFTTEYEYFGKTG